MKRLFRDAQLEKSIEDLFTRITIGGYSYPDAIEINKAVENIIKTKKRKFSKENYMDIYKYLQTSDAFLSADYMEDIYDFDFKDKKVDFTVDYKGNYTFVEDKWLPHISLLEERKSYRKLLNFYITSKNKKLDKKYENIKVQKMHFDQKKLIKMEYTNSVLYGSVFEKCELDSIWFYKTNLEHFSCNECYMGYTKFVNINLCHSMFKECNFDNCDFSENDMDNVKFSNCFFNETSFFQLKNLDKVDFLSCNFEKCYLSFIDLTNAKNLTQEQLNTFLGDDEVLLPKHLKRPDFWPKQADMTTWYHWMETNEVIESKASVDYE